MTTFTEAGVITFTQHPAAIGDAGVVNRMDAEGVVPQEMDFDRWQGGRRLVELGLLVALLVAAVLALPGLDELRDRLAGASPELIALAAAFELGSCLAFVVAFRGVFSGGLSWRFSYQVGMSEQAANVLLPTGGAGGLALGAWALHRVGMPADRIGPRTVAFFLITSAVNFAAVGVAGLGLAMGVLPGEIALATALVPGVLGTLAIAAVVLAPRVLAARTDVSGGRLRAALAKGRASLVDGSADAISLLGSGRPLIIGGAIGYMALDVLALAAVFAAFGGGAPSLGVFVLAYTIGQLGGLIPLPGGIGGTDGGLIAAFVLVGTPIGIAAPAVLGYRAFQLGVPAILGVTAFAQLRRSVDREATAVSESPEGIPIPATPQLALEPA